jgi:mRNA interferase RelE/StbE
LTYEVVWADEAFAAAQMFMGDDPEGLAAVFDVVDRLANDPRPATAFPWGAADLLRVRLGRYRVLYEVEDRVVRIEVIHLGRAG